MRQLDLFGSFFETTSQDSTPAEDKFVSGKEVDSSRPASPSYSKNSLRSERPVTVAPVTAVSVNDGVAQSPVLQTASPAVATLFPSLFDTVPEVPTLPAEETEIFVPETQAETETSISEVEPGNEADSEATFVPTIAVEEVIVEQLAQTPSPTDAVGEVMVRKKLSLARPKKPNVPELKRNGEVIFDDGKISVKIKTKSPFPAPIEKVKKEKEKKLPQKRGRKSFKEIDAEVDLIDIPDDEILFQKQYYPISEVARWFRVNTSLLRFWENEFDVLKPRKNRKGDRLFRPEDVKNLQLIYQLLRQRKYTIEGAKEYIKTNKKKADIQLQLTNTLQKFKSFLLDMKANLQ